MTVVHELGVVRLMNAFRGGRISPSGATQAYFERIERFNGALNAYTALDRDRALADARASDARVAAGEPWALEGVPIAVKANIAVEGLATTAGVGALRDDIAREDAEVVKQLRAAGAIILGHVNMHEAALGATTSNPHFGATQNPHRLGFTPGGSSGGSAAAVAAGLCAAALGTDTLGSIRIPAAYCGVYGLKPTHGLVSDAGVVPLARRLDAVGPLARSVADIAAVMEVLAPLAPAATALKVATLDVADTIEVERAAHRAYRTAVDLVRGIGIDVQDYGSGGLDLASTRTAGFVESARDAKAFYADAMARDPRGFSETFAGHLDFAGRFDAAALAAGATKLDEAVRLLRGILADAAAIFLPTTRQAAHSHDAPPPPTPGDFTALANFAGLPAISVPAGWTDAGLPVGVQLIGRANGERTLIALAARLDAVLKGYAMPIGYD